jgi:adenylyltransferase/sulfurtransferase
MPISIQIPTALRNFTERKNEVEVGGATVGAAITALAGIYPDLKPHLFQDDGAELRPFINVFLEETNIKKLQGLATPVADGATIMLVPAIAGGVVFN